MIRIGGVNYTGVEQDMCKGQNALYDAVKALPSPLPDVRFDYDPEMYHVEKSTITLHDYIITVKQGKDLKDGDDIQGKDGYLFSKKIFKTEDKEAYHVGQGDAILVKGGKVGTTNVQDCVALIVQDKKVQQTALAHIASVTSERKIKEILSSMPEGEKEVIMVGGRYEHRGAYKVDQILQILAQYPYGIVINQSYVCDSDYIHNESYNFSQSCYELNTSFGSVTVDTSDLKVTCDYPTRDIPFEICFSNWVPKEEDDLIKRIR